MAADPKTKLARQVFRAIQHPDFRTTLPRDKQGQPLPIVIALQSDTLGHIFAQADRIGKRVAVVVPVSSKTFGVLTMSRSKTRVKPGMHPDDCILHPATELAMLLIYLRDVNRVARCHFTSPDRTIALVDDGLPAHA